MRRLALLILPALAVAVVGIPMTASGSGSTVTVGQAGDPLVGVWRTAPVPVARIRTAILAANFTQADVDTFLDGLKFTSATSLQFAYHFYTLRGRRVVEQMFWDAAKKPPCCGDQGPYELLSNRRLTISSDHPDVNDYRYVFRYRVSGKMLTLRFLSGTNKTLSKKELRFDKVVMTAAATAPYSKIK